MLPSTTMKRRGSSIAKLVAGGFVAVAAAPSAQAQPRATTATTTFGGDVIAARGRWTSDHRTIVTDAVVRTPTGDVDVLQLGGHADGYTMTIIHGAEQLVPGQRVVITAHPTTAGAVRPRWLLDDVDVRSGPRAAGPFVRTNTNVTKVPVHWAKSCVEVSRAREGTIAIAADAEASVIVQSITTWNASTASCSYLNLVDLGAVASEIGNDGVNLIKFRDTEWCRPAVDGNEQHCFSHQASGITTLLFVDDAGNDRNGEIVDADIELNGVDFAISTNGQSESQLGCKADLANTLVHELGHLLGLGHTCLGPADSPRNDGAGNPVPLCSETIDATIIDSTMYPFQACGETSKASLSADDASAICTIYPLADDPGACEGPDDLGGGCCDQGGGAGGPLTLALATLFVLVPRRRRA